MDYNFMQNSQSLENQMKKSEKLLMKSIEMQQRKIMEDRRRRAERNQNLLADLNRINRQASILAAKSERMRILKKQYERYLMSLWAKRSQTYSAPMQQTTNQFFTTKSPTMSMHSSASYQPYREVTPFITSRPIKSNLVKHLSATNVEPSPMNLYSEWFNEEKHPNYGNEKHYNSQLNEFGFNDSILQQTNERKFTPSQSQYGSTIGVEKPKRFDIKSSKSFNPLCQQPFEQQINKSPTVNISQGNAISAHRQTSYAEVSPTPRPVPVPNIIISLSDDEDSVSEKDKHVYNLIQNKRRMSIMKPNELKIPLKEIENFISDETPAILESTEVKKISTNTIYYSDPPPFIITKKEDSSHVIAAGENQPDKLPVIKAEEFLIDEYTNDNDLEYKEIQEPDTFKSWQSPAPETTKFIIPKIIVEPQQTDIQTISNVDSFIENQQGNDSQTSAEISKQISEQLNNNYINVHHLSEQQNASTFALKGTDKSPVEKSPIYHHDVESHLENVENINFQLNQAERHMESKDENGMNELLDNKTIELETNDSNLSMEYQEKGIEEIINNNQTLEKNSTSMELNDKINKIYKKIEKIEDEYYGEKVKIVENFGNTDNAKQIMESSKTEFKAEQLNENLGNLDNENIQIIQERNFQDNVVPYANETEESNNNISQAIEENSIKNWEIDGRDDVVNDVNTNASNNNNFIYSEDDANRQLINTSTNEWSQENIPIPTNYEYQADPAFDMNAQNEFNQQQFDYNQDEYMNVGQNPTNQNEEYNYVQEPQFQPQIVSYQEPSELQQAQYDNNYYSEGQQNPNPVDENQYQQEYYDNKIEGEMANQFQSEIYQDENQIFQPEYIEQPHDEANMNYLTNETHNLNLNDNVDQGNVDPTNNFINESQYTNNTNFANAEYDNNQENQVNESMANQYDDNQITNLNESADYSTIEKNEYEEPENIGKFETQKYDTENDSFTTSSSTAVSSTTNSNSTTSQSLVKKKKSVEFADDIKTNTDNPIEHSKADEVVMMKQLLGDESDDNSIKSNMMKHTSEKDNVDESDFEFSANSEAT